jgi:RND family efflux transporter MFP subunit
MKYLPSLMVVKVVAALLVPQITLAAEPYLADSFPGLSSLPSIGSQEIRAQLSPRRYTTIAAEIGAKVNSLGAREGGSFKEGDELVGFDCALQRAQLQKARAALAASEKTFASNQRLSELNSVGQLELDLSEAEVGKARAEMESNAAVVSKCSIVAPYSGRVAEQKVHEQQYVQPGTPMLEILDDSVLELEFIVPSRWLSWVKPDSRFYVHIDETGKKYPARVLRVGAKVDPVSQSVKLMGTIDGHFPELVAGMGGRVSMSRVKTKASK